MATIRKSASNSIISAFDTAVSVFDAAEKLVSTAARSVDAFDDKMRTFCEGVAVEEEMKRIRQSKEIRMSHALEHKEFLDDIARKLNSEDEIKAFEAIESDLSKALEERKAKS